MLCSNCSRLAIQHLNKKCMLCQSPVFQNISIICEACSTHAKQCSACLKKTDNSIKKPRPGGCGSCRK